MKVIPCPLICYLISLIQVQNGCSLYKWKKVLFFKPAVLSTTAILFANQKLLTVMQLVSIYVLTLILSGKLGANLPK